MEYVFGTEGELEVLKTKGREHTRLTGFQETRREYSDCIITDSYRIAEYIGGAEDAEGNCYDWYVIDRHYRTVDKATVAVDAATRRISDLEDALCDADAATAEWRETVENALCDLDGGEN